MTKKPLEIDTLAHKEARRRNIPTAEYESVMHEEEKTPIRIAYERRNRDLDPQLVWRGKDEQDWSDLVVAAPPLYIQEKVHPKVLIDDLVRLRRTPLRATEGSAAIQPGSPRRSAARDDVQPDLFADFNGLADPEARCEFYAHDQNWSNRMILGDSLQVMASLAERESLRGKVQCIYIDPPYGIKFNSNFQWSTTSRDVKDGKSDHITREPEQVKAFRDTWRDGIHSYLTYLRDRLTVARDLLSDSGSIFVQIGDENVHRVRAALDEIFGDDNFVDQIVFQTSSGRVSDGLDGVYDVILWYAKSKTLAKFRKIKKPRSDKQLDTAYNYLQFEDGSFRVMTKLERDNPENLPSDARRFRPGQTQSQSGGESSRFTLDFQGEKFLPPPSGGWRTSENGFARAAKAYRLMARGKSVAYRLCDADNPMIQMTNIWTDTVFVAFGSDKAYIVQTNPLVLERCILMTTDPGDLVLDPTCGSGTTAYVAEQWGRRWITIDTSRVALALARARIMGARYPWYILADSPEGQRKEWGVSGKAPPSLRATEGSAAIQSGSPRGSAARDDERAAPPTRGDIRLGFVYERVPHITLKSIANNAEIDVIWERFQAELEPLRAELNAALGRSSSSSSGLSRGSTPSATKDVDGRDEHGHDGRGKPWQEWEIPREADAKWPDKVKALHKAWWDKRIERQKEIDASIAAKADVEYLYDKPYVDNSRVRVAGPFTVETLSPHRVLAVSHDDELIDTLEAARGKRPAPERSLDEADFAEVILENLKTSGVQQAHKEDRITFTAITGWPGNFICAEGRFMEGEKEKRAGIFIGPEFGTVARPDLVAAAREAGDAGFDVLIACAFNYDAHSAEFDKLGRIPVLKARMNADLHMADELKNTGKGNLFVIFGEPDIDIQDAGEGQVRVKINGVDVFHPQTGEIASSGPEGIACWFIDTDYNEESFFVRHAYFLGANDPYKALKTTLKAEIDEDAWVSLNSDTSRPFDKPSTGRIAVKVINHLGDEVMKVFGV